MKIFFSSREIFSPPLLNTNATRKTEDFSRRKISLFLVQRWEEKKTFFVYIFSLKKFSYMWLWKAKKDCKLSPWTCGKVNRIFLQLNIQKLSYRALDLAHFTSYFSHWVAPFSMLTLTRNFSTRPSSVYTVREMYQREKLANKRRYKILFVHVTLNKHENVSSTLLARWENFLFFVR